MIYLISAYLIASLTIPNLVINGINLLPVCSILLLLFNYKTLRHISKNLYLIIFVLIITQIYFLSISVVFDYFSINLTDFVQRSISCAGPVSYVLLGIIVSRMKGSRSALKLTVVCTTAILVMVNALMISIFNDLFWLRQLETLDLLAQINYGVVSQSIFTNANQTARTILFLSIIVFFTKAHWTPTSYLLLLLCLTCLIVITSSKANILAIFVLLFSNVLLSSLHGFKKLITGFVAVTIFFIAVIAEPRFQKLIEDVEIAILDDVSQKYQPIRMRNLLASLEVISDNPFGSGIIEAERKLMNEGSFKQIAGKTIYIPPHGSFLKFSVYYGILGATIFFLWFLISMASYPQIFIALTISSLGADVFALAFPFILIGLVMARSKNG